MVNPFFVRYPRETGNKPGLSQSEHIVFFCCNELNRPEAELKKGSTKSKGAEFLGYFLLLIYAMGIYSCTSADNAKTKPTNKLIGKWKFVRDYLNDEPPEYFDFTNKQQIVDFFATNRKDLKPKLVDSIATNFCKSWIAFGDDGRYATYEPFGFTYLAYSSKEPRYNGSFKQSDNQFTLFKDNFDSTIYYYTYQIDLLTDDSLKVRSVIGNHVSKIDTWLVRIKEP